MAPTRVPACPIFTTLPQFDLHHVNRSRKQASGPKRCSLRFLHLLYILWSKFLGQGIIYKPIHLNGKAEMRSMTYESPKQKGHISPGSPLLITDKPGEALPLPSLSFSLRSHSGAGNSQHLLLQNHHNQLQGLLKTSPPVSVGYLSERVSRPA